jgi:glycosyltransferase involved in cell wall biosynthesis
MEQTLGHVTHAQNLRMALEQAPSIDPLWLPIPFDVQGLARCIPLYRGNWSVRASWRARRALGAAHATERLDALFFHTQVTSLFSVDLMRRIPTVISLDATPLNYDEVGASYGHRAAGDGFIDRQKFRLNCRALQAAEALIAWSAWTKRSLVERYGVQASRVRVLPPGAADAFFEVGRRRLAAAEASAQSDCPVRMLFVGGDWERKGGPILLEALAGLPAGSWQLDVVTRAEVAPRPGVVVHRNVGPNSPELLRLFAEADLFVLPSLGECLAVVLMEATAAALPVITTDVGALAEAVQPGETGLIVPPRDARALRDALERLIEDRVARRAMGRAAQTFATERFVATKNNQQILQLLAEQARLGARPGRAA